MFREAVSIEVAFQPYVICGSLLSGATAGAYRYGSEDDGESIGPLLIPT
jgi:hypothetical protein